jgi:hypothetical protein
MNDFKKCITAKKVSGYEFTNHFIDNIAIITSDAYVSNMKVSEEDQAMSREMAELAYSEFIEFLKKYATNNSDYAGLLTLLDDRPPKEPILLKPKILGGIEYEPIISSVPTLDIPIGTICDECQ